ncbi:hypothetical protein FCU94_06255 [Vibrio sp. JPW-9-11-11]|uniref:hypothetical protein n=1 Tax=Vibrio sp. JPW-9-11-11 TaxID=1416532 RepID=UPI001593B226|nr:hypothetical protein [Vibrio sp. JPW-9-11-11]NVD06511.1 hypothetical protein [Vibrio sp. JPW-9-11-11]
MKKTKRVIWVPYGYRRRSIVRQTARRARSRQDVQEVQELQTSTDHSHNERSAKEKPNKGEKDLSILNSGDSATQDSDSRVASFSPEFNPYRAYLNDMMHCLSGIPSETFLYEPKKEREAEKQAEKDGSETYSKLPSRENVTLEEMEATPHGPNAEQGSANEAQYIERQTINTLEQKSASECVTANLKTETLNTCHTSDKHTLENDPKPHLRWLTGIRTCLRAK